MSRAGAAAILDGGIIPVDPMLLTTGRALRPDPDRWVLEDPGGWVLEDPGAARGLTAASHECGTSVSDVLNRHAIPIARTVAT